MKRKKSDTDSYWFNIVLVILGIIGLWCWFTINAGNYVTTNNAIVEGRLLTINSRVAGFVTHVYATNSLEVKKGDLVAEVDSTDIIIKLRQSEDKLKTAKIKLAIYEKQAALEKEQSNRLIDYDNFARTYGEGIVQHTENKQVLTETKPAMNGKLLNEPNSAEEEEEKFDPNQLREDIKKYEAEIEQLKLDLSNTKIYASQDGTVSGINIKEGDFIEPAEPILSVIPKRVWVSAYYTEEQIDKISAGQPVVVKINKYPTRRFKGVVDDVLGVKENEHTANKKFQVKIMFTEDYSEFDIPPGSKVSVSVKIK